MTLDELRQDFEQFGRVDHIQRYKRINCALIKFSALVSADNALYSLQQKEIGRPGSGYRYLIGYAGVCVAPSTNEPSAIADLALSNCRRTKPMKRSRSITVRHHVLMPRYCRNTSIWLKVCDI